MCVIAYSWPGDAGPVPLEPGQAGDRSWGVAVGRGPCARRIGMISAKVPAAGGAVALVVSGFGELAQYAVAPAHISGGTAAEQVAAVAGQGGLMQLGLWVDLLILAIIPAVLYLGRLADSRRSGLAATGTVVAFVGALGAGYLLANDVLVYAASRAKDQAGAVEGLSGT